MQLNQFYIHPCVEGEWRLVVDDKYSNPTADDCPNGWSEISTASRRFCARSSLDFDNPTCDSAFFAVSDGPYGRVCGKIVGYGHGLNGGFAPSETEIGSVYVNGLSLTHGMSTQREHIWTFAIGYAERAIRVPVMFQDNLCPCLMQSTASVPEFVNNDFFGESEETFSLAAFSGHHLDDPLRDGRQCLNDCCRGSPFVKTLANGPTTDPLEIRICNVQAEYGENILVEEVKIYVQ